MALSSKAGFKGIVTACGEVTADPGALRVADNVTLRKEGSLTLRSTFGSTALARAYLAAFPYKGSLYYVAANNVLYSPTQTPLSYQSGYPAAVRADIQSAKEARGNLYFATASGIFKVTSTSDTTLRPTGLRASAATFYGTGRVTTSIGTPLLLAPNTQAGYRLVTKYTDPNGVIVRSRPSGASIAANTTGASLSPIIELSNNGAGIAGFAAFDEVELYRTRVFPTTVQIDEEYQLVATIKYTDFSGGIALFTDRVPDAQRGTTLYTSPSRGGIEGANDRPPAAACIERFRTSLFFGNTRGPQQYTVSWKWGGNALAGSATGVGVRAITANSTNGSPTLTSVSPVAGIRVGQFINGAVQPGAYITAVSGTTVTMSANATATATGTSLNAFDQIWIGPVNSLSNAFLMQWAGTNSNSALSSYVMAGSYDAYELTPAAPGYDVTLVIRENGRSATPLDIRSTRGDETSPVLPLATAASGASSTSDVFPHGLAWSEPDEPEHVPPKNFARVGDAGKAILALVATKDRLLIWKEDGLFMLTGDTSKNFGIYPLDTTCLCVLPGSVQRLQNVVYGLTNLGLVAIDEGGGVNIVSRSVQNEVAPIITAIRQAQKASGLYNMPGLSGVTGTADDANGEYWLMLGTTTPSFGGQMLVWNAFQQGFTTYSFGTPTPVAVARDGEGLPLVLTASSLLTPGTTLGAITARVSPRAFSDPALTQKLWTHVVAGFSKLTGTASVTAKFSGSVSMLAGTEASEVMDVAGAVDGSSLVQLPLGSLLKHPVPLAMRRAYLAFVELVVAVTNGTFTLDVVAMESRENIPQKDPTHGSGAS